MRNLIIAFALLLGPIGAFAQNQITYQGALNQSGAPVTGTRTLGFTLHADPIQDSEIEFLGEYPVDIVEGLFKVALDTVGEFRSDLYLEIYVVDGGQNVVLSPRERITNSPRSIYSLHTRGLFVSPIGRVGVNDREAVAQLQVKADTGLGESLRLLHEEHFGELQFTGSMTGYDLQARDSDLDRPLNLGLNRAGGAVVVGAPGVRFDDATAINSAGAPRVPGVIGQASATVGPQSVSPGTSVALSATIPGTLPGDFVIANDQSGLSNPFVLSTGVAATDVVFARITFIDTTGSVTTRQLPETTVNFLVLRP